MNPSSRRARRAARSWAKAIGDLRRRFQRDRSGIAAVEFALLVPFLLTLYLGTVELTQGVILNRKTTLAAETIGNIVAQYTTISQSSQLPDILAATNQIFAPYSTTPASVLITCINIDANGNATVAWSQGTNATARVVGSTITLPTALDVASTTVLLSEASYSYTAPFDFLHLGAIKLYSPIYMSPRASTTINLVS
jgi:Flp pilus assembly protein TadG